MNAMHYKGYAARIEYSEDDICFVGRIIGIKDVIGFHSDSVKDLQIAFKEAVDDYLETCEKIGQSPNKPYSGKILLRVPPEVHAAAATAAEIKGKSLNQWVTETLTNATHI